MGNDQKDTGSYCFNLIVSVGMASGLLYVGISNVDNCPVENMIPIYLIGTYT